MVDVSAKPRAHRRAWKWRITLLAVALAAIAGGLAYGLRRASVQAVRATKRDVVQTVVATGKVVPPAVIEIRARAAGAVTQVEVSEGDSVKRGALLVHLDDSVLLARQASIAAAVVQAQLKLDSFGKVLSPAAAENLKQADLAAAQSQDDFTRMQVLVASGAASDAQLDAARNALGQARSRRQGLALQASTVSTHGTDYQMALSVLTQAEARADEAKAALLDAHLVAPFDGVILKRSVDVGDVVQPGATLLVMAAQGDAQILVPIDESNLAGLAVGSEAIVSAEAFPEKNLAASVIELAPMVDAARGTLDVKLGLTHAPAYLRPEMTVSVEIELARRSAAIAVPVEALREGGSGKPYVFTVEGGRTEKRPIGVGIRGDDAVEVVSGLSEGDLVVTSPAPDLAAGTRVRADVAPLK